MLHPQLLLPPPIQTLPTLAAHLPSPSPSPPPFPLHHGVPPPVWPPIPWFDRPPIDPFLRPIDTVYALVRSFRRLSSVDPADHVLPCDLHLEQRSLLCSLSNPRLLCCALRSSRLHISNVHHRVVLSAWLRFKRREDELEPLPPPLLLPHLLLP